MTCVASSILFFLSPDQVFIRRLKRGHGIGDPTGKLCVLDAIYTKNAAVESALPGNSFFGTETPVFTGYL